MINFPAVTVPAFHPPLALSLLPNYFRFSNAILLLAVIPCPFPFGPPRSLLRPTLPPFRSLYVTFSLSATLAPASIADSLPLLPSSALSFPFPSPVGCDAMDTSALSSSTRARTTNRPSFKYFQKESILRKYPRRACGNGDARAVPSAREREREAERAEP